MKESKNFLIVHAHSVPNSFCSALKDEAKIHLDAQGNIVEISDLYAMGFNPIGGSHDFLQTSNPNYFKYQAEQLHASQNNLFEPSLQSEIDKLFNCDVLIFNFPLWWFSLPAMLKGWVDRVFAMGKVYGGGIGVYNDGIFHNKSAFLTFTTGGPQQAYNETGRNGNLDTILFPIHHGMLFFCGFTVYQPFISFAPVRKTQEERAEELLRYRNYLDNFSTTLPIYKAVKV